MNELEFLEEKDIKKISDISIDVINMETMIELLENEQEQPIHNSFFPELDEIPILSDKVYNKMQQEIARTVYGDWDRANIKVTTQLAEESFLNLLNGLEKEKGTVLQKKIYKKEDYL